MTGEAPGRGAFQAGGGEGVEAQLSGAGVDVVSDGLQGREVLDLIQRVAGIGQQLGVDDDTEGLVAVAHGLQLTGLVVEVEVVGGQLTGERRSGQIQSVLIPVLQAGHVADVVDGGSAVLAHLGVQGVGVVAGSSGYDLDRHAGLLGVAGGQTLQSLVELGLEVQVVDGTGSGGRVGLGLGGGSVNLGFGGSLGLGSGLGAAGGQTHYHDNCQQQCNQLFHLCFLLFSFRQSRMVVWKRFQRFHVNIIAHFIQKCN